LWRDILILKWSSIFGGSFGLFKICGNIFTSGKTLGWGHYQKRDSTLIFPVVSKSQQQKRMNRIEFTPSLLSPVHCETENLVKSLCVQRQISTAKKNEQDLIHSISIKSCSVRDWKFSEITLCTETSFVVLRKCCLIQNHELIITLQPQQHAIIWTV
jgi:hypothetical protein